MPQKTPKLSYPGWEGVGGGGYKGMHGSQDEGRGL